MDTPLFPDALDPWASQEPPQSVDWERAIAKASASVDPNDLRERTRLRVVERAVTLLANTPGMVSLTLALETQPWYAPDQITGWADTHDGVVDLSVDQLSPLSRALERAAKDVFRLTKSLPSSDRRAFLGEVFQTPITLENAGFRLNVPLEGLDTQPEPNVPGERTPRPRP